MIKNRDEDHFHTQKCSSCNCFAKTNPCEKCRSHTKTEVESSEDLEVDSSEDLIDIPHKIPKINVKASHSSKTKTKVSRIKSKVEN
jgi:hypothetical protein